VYTTNARIGTLHACFTDSTVESVFVRSRFVKRLATIDIWTSACVSFTPYRR